MKKLDALAVDRPEYRAAESWCHADMVWIPGGTFHMGSDKHYAEESPVHRVVGAGSKGLPGGSAAHAQGGVARLPACRSPAARHP